MDLKTLYELAGNETLQNKMEEKKKKKNSCETFFFVEVFNFS